MSKAGKRKKNNRKAEPVSYIHLAIALINLVAAILMLIKNNTG